jgi:putative ABC transport system permease protein
VTTWVRHARYAVRQLRHTPSFTIAAIATLAIAIGANTAIFSVVYGVLLRPLPYRGGDRLIRLSEEHPGGRPLLPEALLSNLTFHAWTGASRTVEDAAAYSSRNYTVAIVNESLRLNGAAVSPVLFELLGVVPAAGRFFTPSEVQEGQDQVVVLSHGAWQRRFGGSSSAIGTAIAIDGKPFVIVGVAPAWFYFPDRDAELWTPFAVPPVTKGGTSVLRVLARLAPGATLAQVEAEGTGAARTVARPVSATLLFGEGGPVQVRARLMIDQLSSRIRPALLVMAAGVSLVLLIACANVASLLLARGVARRRELLVRHALGASRLELLRQLVTESLLLSLFGGAVGVLLAWTLVRLLPAFAPADFPRLDEIALDPRVLAFAFVASALAGIAAGVFPALRGTFGLGRAVRVDDGRTAGSGRDVLRGVLLGAEAALGVMLIVAASLLMRSFVALVSVDGGYTPDNLLTARVYRQGDRPDSARSEQFVRALVDRLRSGPGVVAAGAGNMAPFGESSFVSGFQLPGTAAAGKPVIARAISYVVTPGYAEALGMRLRAGRFFEAADLDSKVQRILVSESFARTYLADGGPVAGRTFPDGLVNKSASTEIVGVVADVLKDGLTDSPQPAIYLAHGGPERGIRREVNVLIRTAGDPLDTVPFLRTVVRDLDPTAALGAITPMGREVAQSVAAPRFAALTIAAFATIALLLAATGLYGVLSYNVSQRRREIGVRAALGATRGDLLALVVRHGLVVTTAGVATGLLASAATAPLLRRVLFGIEPLDVASFVAAPAILLLVGLAASLIPARRAASVDPAEALRAEGRWT